MPREGGDMSWGKSHDMVWVMRTCRWFRLARTYASREGDMSWWIMAYCTSIEYDTGICNTARGISQDIPLCPSNSYPFPSRPCCIDSEYKRIQRYSVQPFVKYVWRRDVTQTIHFPVKTCTSSHVWNKIVAIVAIKNFDFRFCFSVFCCSLQSEKARAK